MRRLRGSLGAILVLAAVFAAVQFGALNVLSNLLYEQRLALLPRDASGDLVFVEIDPRSIQELGVWPWPRAYYATVLDRLIDLGATRVGFDIDFSSRSASGDDPQLAASFAAAGGRAVLPVFRQVSRDKDGQRVLVTSRPLPAFAQQARTASINIRPDPDGKMRRMRWIDRIEGRPVPSMLLMLAGTQFARAGDYLIDFGVRPDSIPRISFVDVLDGRVPAGLFDGRRAVIGSSAVELGDYLPTPVWGVLPGAIVNILAAESIVQGRTIRSVSSLPVLLATIVVIMVLWPGLVRWNWRGGAVVVVAGGAAAFAASLAALSVAPIDIDPTPVIAALALAYVVAMTRRIDSQALRLFIQNMAAVHRLELLRTVVDHSADATVIVLHDGSIKLCNPAAESLFGRSESAMEGLPVSQLFDVAGDPRTGQIVGALEHVGPAGLSLDGREIMGKTASGERIPMEITVSCARAAHSDDALERRKEGRWILICALRDIRKRKAAEAAYEAAMEKKLEAERAKSDFLSNANHELRTPLNHIIGFTEMLRVGYLGPVDDAQASYLVDIERSGRHLLRIVEDVLAFSERARVQAARLDEREFSLNVLLQRRVANFRVMAGKAGVDVDTSMIGDREIVVAADRAELRRALDAILYNAVKFNREGGQLSVSLRLNAEREIEIAVMDTGIGMNEEEQRRALEPFGQAEDAMARERGGIGIGLPLAKEIARLHGGRLELYSAPGQGTVVQLILPAERLRESAAMEDGGTAEPGAELLDELEATAAAR